MAANYHSAKVFYSLEALLTYMLPGEPDPLFNSEQARRFWSKKWRNSRHSKNNPMVLKCALCAAKKPYPGPSWNKPLKDNVVLKEEKKRLRNEE